MKPWPRTRAVMLWGGAAMTVVIVAAWVVSGWVFINYNGLPWVCGLSRGVAFFMPRHPGAPYLEPGWHGMWLNRVEFPKSWFFAFVEVDQRLGVTVHCGLLAAPFAGMACVAWRANVLARRRARAGLCPRCRYDLRATPADLPCPECGGVR